MKRWVWLLLLFPLLTSCMTANQLAAEKSFYEMLIAVQANRAPMLDIKIADPTKPANIERIIVNMPSSQEAIRQYVQVNYAQPWLNLLGAGLPWLGAWGIVKAVGDIAGGNTTTYSQSISGQSAGQFRVMGDLTPGNITGSGNMVGGMIDQTSIPTIVEQPAPVVIYAP